MLNKVMLQGRLTHEPELKYTPNGIAIVRFSLAVQRSYVKQGEEIKSDFINCIAFKTQAEFISRYFDKGSLVVVAGELQTKTWEEDDGKKRTATEVIINEVHFCESKKTEKSSDAESKYLNDERNGIAEDSFFEEINKGNLPF